MEKRIREMKVYYSTESQNRFSNGDLKPMIRIANNILYKAGFRVGHKIDVDYGENSLVITRK